MVPNVETVLIRVEQQNRPFSEMMRVFFQQSFDFSLSEILKAFQHTARFFGMSCNQDFPSVIKKNKRKI
jgi:hypothetical protein